MLIILGLIVSTSKFAASAIEDSRLPDGTVGNWPGDLYLGGLFPIHQKDLLSGTCADELRPDGLIHLEAFRYSLEEINNRTDLLPGVRLGAVALDTCSSEKYAVGMALKLMLFKDLTPRSPAKGQNFMFGVVGPHSTSVSVQVANLLSLLSISQVTYGATSSDLSHEAKFPYLLRTVPSDFYLTRAIVQLLRSHNWTYITTIFDDTSYGLAAFRDFEMALKEGDVCSERNYRINVENPYHHSAPYYEETVALIDAHREMNVVVAFVVTKHLAGLLRAAKRLGFDDRFVWIGSDAWGTRLVEPNLRSVLEGSLMVTPLLKDLPGLRQRFVDSMLTAERDGNSLLVDLQSSYHNSCKAAVAERLINTNFTANESDPNNYTAVQQRSTEECRISAAFLYRTLTEVEFRQAHYVRTAVYTFAGALSRLLRKKCGSDGGICPNFRYQLNSYNILKFSREILAELKRSAASGLDAMNVTKYDGRDGPPQYSLLNFQKFGHEYKWIEVGQYEAIDNHSMAYKKLTGGHLYKEKFNFSYPPSHCGQPCEADQVQHFSQLHMCCHTCEPCKFPSVKINWHNCTLCDAEKFQQPNVWRNGCESIPTEFGAFEVAVDPLSLVILSLCASGLALESLTVLLYLVYLHTPIIRASGRELSAVTLVGLLVGLISAGFLILTPTPFNCGFIRFFYGLSYAVCYAAILVKTNRIERIFRTKTTGNKKLRYTSPRSQLIVVSLIVSLQVAINVVWLLFRSPRTKLLSEVDFLHETVRVYHYCESFEDLEMGVTLIYPAVLLLLCLAYAFKTRKLPGAFSEAKAIFIATHTTFVLWLAFVPIFFALDRVPIRIFVLGMAIIVNANVTLVCMFWPKLYVALCRPEKNTKATLMANRNCTKAGAKETSFGEGQMPDESEPLDQRIKTTFQPDTSEDSEESGRSEDKPDLQETR